VIEKKNLLDLHEMLLFRDIADAVERSRKIGFLPANIKSNAGLLYALLWCTLVFMHIPPPGAQRKLDTVLW